MSRRARSYLPGCAFHITARTHLGEFWLDQLRDDITGIIELGLRRSDARLLAFTIMSDHMHLVIRQGNAPLAQLMHPICQRTAYAVHRRHKRNGYVMGYRYFDTPCIDEAHLRNAIVYTHRNPVAAGMCSQASDYKWSSDRAYRSGSPDQAVAGLIPAIELFASGVPDRTAQQDYADFYAWYDACKNLGPDDLRPHTPGVTAGDEYWMQNFGTKHEIKIRRKRDLRDVISRSLTELTPILTIDDLRNGGRNSAMLAVRAAVIERASRAGHRPASIARFLNISDSTVARVRAAMADRLAVQGSQ